MNIQGSDPTYCCTHSASTPGDFHIMEYSEKQKKITGPP